MMLRAAALLAAFAVAPALAAPSFDCARAASAAEKAVCADQRLAGLDELAARYYAGAVEQLRENGACIKDGQAEWLAKRRDRCGADAACLNAAYLDRLAELRALQPGLNAPRRLELPPRSPLLWAIAPDDDQPAPARRALRDVEVDGALVRGKDGYAIREVTGREVVLVPDSLLGGSTAVALESLIASPGHYRLRARGHVGRGPRGGDYFDHHHCILIWQDR